MRRFVHRTGLTLSGLLLATTCAAHDAPPHTHLYDGSAIPLWLGVLAAVALGIGLFTARLRGRGVPSVHRISIDGESRR